jgi:hypothetical protein
VPSDADAAKTLKIRKRAMKTLT